MADGPDSARAVYQRRRHRQWPVLALLAASLLGHGLLGLLLFGLSALTAHPPRPKRIARPVALRAIDPRAWSTNRLTTGPSRSSAPGTRPRAPMPTGQVVDVAPGNRQVPVESKYLAETNNRVEKETRARTQVAAPGMAGRRMTSAGAVAPPAVARPIARAAAARSALTARQDRFSGLDGPAFRPRITDLYRLSAERAAPAAPAPNPLDSAGTEQSDTPGTTNGAVGSGASGAANDDLQGVAKGDGTFLNTREFVFAGFFNRVKQAISAQWKPQAVMDARDPQHRTLGSMDRKTVVVITIDADGVVKDLYVQKGSGSDLLDAEAVRAVEHAGPFPNPPALLFEGAEVFRFPFGFFLDMSGSGMPQMFRPH